MKCPKCGAWNAAYLPKCVNCGTALPENMQKQSAQWEDSLHKKKPYLRVATFESGDVEPVLPADDGLYDPERIVAEALTDEVEELGERRERGSRRLEQMREQAERVRRSVREAEIIRPLPEEGDETYRYASDPAVIRQRQARRQSDYETGALYQDNNGYFSDIGGQPMAYDDDDENAPYFYDGFVPESGDQGALNDANYMPRRVQTANGAYESSMDEEEDESPRRKRRKKRHPVLSVILRVFLTLLVLAGAGVGSILVARQFVINQGIQLTEGNETSYEVEAITTEDGLPAHRVTIFARENASIYLRETQKSYVVADGRVTFTIPDYMWYDTENSTFATAVDTDTMDVTISPFIRFAQEGDQYAMEQISYTIDVPLSPLYLVNPPTAYKQVGVSIFEVRINVQKGSTVYIDGTNVSTLIRDTGNVSKNVQVLPIGDNTISISVKSKYCRENKAEIVLHREEQEIPLELDATVITEWNNLASDTDHPASISGTTLPGATITVESPHDSLKYDPNTGVFSFRPIFKDLGDNDVIIRAAYDGRKDAVITHTVYFMPNADIYTRKAWDLDSQYSDLVNYISIRKGTIYVGTGEVIRIIGTAPQLAIMNIGNDTFEKLVLIENSSKTTWTVGTRYRVYGDVYGMYDSMPRLTVRYTYLDE